MPPLELTRTQLRATLDALGAIGEASRSADEFAHAGVERLPRLVASEVTTLSWASVRALCKSTCNASTKSWGSRRAPPR
jgi:hypothetical protein